MRLKSAPHPQTFLEASEAHPCAVDAVPAKN